MMKAWATAQVQKEIGSEARAQLLRQGGRYGGSWQGMHSVEHQS